MIGNKIREAVQRSGKSSKEIAELLNISVQNLYKIYKKGSVESNYLVSLAKILGIPISSFFPGEWLNIEEALADKHSTRFILHKYLQDIEQLRRADIPFEIKMIRLKRMDYLQDHLANFVRLESMFNIIEDIESTLINGTAESSIKYLDYQFLGKLPAFFNKQYLKDMIDNELIYNKYLEAYLKKLIENDKT